MRLAATIPAAGKKTVVELTGRSVIIESSGLYSSLSEVPTFKFSGTNAANPIYPFSVFQSPSGKFNSIDLIGTSESAGDTVHFLTFDECLDSNIQPAFSISGQKAVCGTSFKKTMNDTVQSISELEITNAAGTLASAVYIAAAEADINYLFKTNPSTGGNDYVLKAGKKKATGKIRVNAPPAADETYEIEVFGISISVSALAADSVQQISDKIEAALNADALFSSIATASNGGTATTNVTVDSYTAAYNGAEITTTATDTDLSLRNINGGKNQSVEPLKISGVDFILGLRFINAVATETPDLIVTPEF